MLSRRNRLNLVLSGGAILKRDARKFVKPDPDPTLNVQIYRVRSVLHFCLSPQAFDLESR
jgi:hypothetical protein